MSRFPALIIKLAALLLVLAFIGSPQSFEPVFQLVADPSAPAIYTQDSLLNLAIQHVLLVSAATVLAAVIAVGLALLVTRPFGAEFLPFSRSVVAIGQTFPPVAVLALCVPILGFGNGPTLIALVLYGLLPIFENALTALENVPPAITEAARGAGMTDFQRLWQVEMPLALPFIIAGIRLSAVIGIATATIGSTVAAKTLGEVIVAGLQSYNYAYILQGGLLVAALALIVHEVLSHVERMARRRARAL